MQAACSALKPQFKIVRCSHPAQGAMPATTSKWTLGTTFLHGLLPAQRTQLLGRYDKEAACPDESSQLRERHLLFFRCIINENKVFNGFHLAPLSFYSKTLRSRANPSRISHVPLKDPQGGDSGSEKAMTSNWSWETRFLHGLFLLNELYYSSYVVCYFSEFSPMLPVPSQSCASRLHKFLCMLKYLKPCWFAHE